MSAQVQPNAGQDALGDVVLREVGAVAVDSGQILVVDPAYVADGLPYDDVAEVTLSRGHGMTDAAGLPGAFVSTTTVGDGHFPLYGIINAPDSTLLGLIVDFQGVFDDWDRDEDEDEADGGDVLSLVVRRLRASDVRAAAPDGAVARAARGDVAYALGRSGAWVRLIDESEALRAAWANELGPAHPAVHGLRANLAAAQTRAGRAAAAMHSIAELLAVLAGDAPATSGGGPDEDARELATAVVTYEAGNERGAQRLADVLGGLMDGLQEALGAEHRVTLMTRMSVGCLLAEAGRVREGLGVLDEVAGDVERLLGRDDALTAATVEARDRWRAAPVPSR